MKKPGAKAPSAGELRRLAVERLRERQIKKASAEETSDPQQLIQELQVHQIELEMQNEELRSVRDELEASLARSTELYDFAPVGYVTLGASSVILEINLDGAALLGKERAHLIGQSLSQGVTAASRPTLEAFLGELRDGKGRASCEVALATHGRDLHVRIDGLREPASEGREWRCSAAMMDITQRKEMEEVLMRQRARLALRYDFTTALSSAVTTADVERIVFENGLLAFGADAGALALPDEQDGEMLELAGQSGYPEELIGAWRRLSVTLASPVTDAYRTGAAVWVESAAAALARFPKWVPAVSGVDDRAWAGLPLRSGGRTLGVLGLAFRHERAFDDEDRLFLESLADRCAQALERARLLESEQQARARAEASEAAERHVRLEAERVGELQRLTLGVVGHDLRSPLQAIKMSSDLLLRQGDLRADQAERVLRISRGANRIAGIIRDLLDYTRARHGDTLQVERHEVDLKEICIAIVLETQSIYPERDIAFESSGECLGAYDPARLGQVISNLLSNALQHGGPSCRVRVSLAVAEAAATLTVFNDGPPIPGEARATIFEPYRRADTEARRAGSGLGLGLFIVREIARAHGGDVAVESSDSGTSFIVRLPRRVA